MDNTERKFPLSRGQQRTGRPLYPIEPSRFLAALSAADRERLSQHLELVHVNSGQSLGEPGERLDYVYLPTTAVVSLQYFLSELMALEVSQVGSEGFLGEKLLGGGSGGLPCRIVVCHEGFCCRVRADVFEEVVTGSEQAREYVFRCIRMVMVQSAQIASCSRHHVLRAQLCRWLLLTSDRARSVELKVTHNLLAQMLGVRRETLSDAAGDIQRMGLIRQRRSSIVLVDIEALAANACGCKSSIRSSLKQIEVGQPPVWAPAAPATASFKKNSCVSSVNTTSKVTR